MKALNDNLVGIVPAGGFGKRMRPLKIWKELIPVGYKTHIEDEKEKHVPKVIAEYTLENMINAGAEKIVMVLNEQKTELFRFFGDGSDYGSSMAYVCQESSFPFYGMPIAFNAAYKWIRNSTVLMGMPDTIVEPFDCFEILLEMHEQKKSDLTIGVFPTNRPNRLAPVSIDPVTGRVKAVYDKPKSTKIHNTWNVAVWSGRFTELLHGYVQEYISNLENASNEMLLSDVFNQAIKENLEVYGHFFSNGWCYDLGNIDEFIQSRHRIEMSHLSKIDIDNNSNNIQAF
jgi:glucose-1-phosphate thymidylyltransferase